MATRWAFTIAALTLAADVAGQTGENPPSIAVVADNQAAVPSDTLAREEDQISEVLLHALIFWSPILCSSDLLISCLINLLTS
jgi:hypothetical protein